MKTRFPLLAGLWVLTNFGSAAPLSAADSPNAATLSPRESLRQLALRQQRAFDADGALKTWRQLAAQFPQDASVLVEAGDALLDAGRYTDAASFYEAWRDFKGAAPEEQAQAIARLAQLAEVQSETDKARTLYLSALPLLPAEGWMAGEIRRRIDDSYARVEDFPGLTAAWESYLETHGRDADVVLHLNRALSQLHRYEEAIAWLRKAAEWAPSREDVKKALAKALRDAAKSSEGGERADKAAGAAHASQDVTAGESAKSTSALLVARAHFQRGENDAALQMARAGLKSDPKNFEWLSLEEAVLARTKQWPQAAELAEKLVTAAPSLASAAEVEDHYVHALRQLGKQEETAQQFAQRLNQGAPLSETEALLFVGLALRNGDIKVAGEALDRLAGRFPDSAGLVYDRAELERRLGHIEPSVAALQRLAELQPAQKEAWWRRITRVYQDENLGDSALAAAHRVVESAPMNPEALALEASVARQARHFEASVASLKEAIRLADRPSPYRRQLARTFDEMGRVDDERETLMAAFDAETDPLARLTMIESLANAYMRSGRLDELIALFRERRRTQNDGWRYAVYLAEIELAIPDPVRAREELAKAWGPRSRDLLFLTESWRISVNTQNTGDRARLARLLAVIDPGKSRELERVSTLIRSGETVEATAALQANAQAVFADPMAWHDTLLLASAAGLGETVTTLLQTGLTQQVGDWRLRFLLAEAHLRTGDFANADQLFRDVESATAEAAAFPPSVLPDANVDRSYEGGLFSGIAYGSGASGAMGSEFARRNTHGFYVRRILERIAAGLRGPSSIVPEQLTLPGSDRFQPEAYLPKTRQEAADAALVMRSVLTQQQGRSAEFVADLQASLKNQPRAERIAQYMLIQAFDPLMKEIAMESAAPSGDEMLNADCLEALMTLSTDYSPGPGGADVDWATLVPLMKTFLQRARQPETVALGKLNLSKMLSRAGREAEAREVARDVLEHWNVVPRAQRWRLIEFAPALGDPEAEEKILEAMLAEPRPAEPAFDEPSLSAYRMKLVTSLLTRKADDPRAVKLLMESLRDSYANPATSLSWQSMLRGRSALQQTQEFPYGSRAIPQPWLSTWTTIFALANDHGLLGPVKAALDQQIETLPAAPGLAARLARVCFLWWAHDRDSAIREVLALADTRKDDELHLLAGSMLAEAGRSDEAQKSFDQVTANSGAPGLDKLARLLVLARTANDAAKARSIALQLAEFPLSYSDRPILQGILTQLGMPEKAAELEARERTRGVGAFYSGLQGAVQQLQRETAAKHQRESVDLARAILARVSPLANAQSEIYYRLSAIDALRQFKALADYTDELEQQLAKNPDSTETLLRLAEAFDRGNANRAITYNRQLVKLNPDDFTSQLRLAELLSRKSPTAGRDRLWERISARVPQTALLSAQMRLIEPILQEKQTEEALHIWENVFAHDPQAVFGDHFSTIFYGFKTAQQMSRLGVILGQAPTRGNPLEGLVLFERDVSFSFDQVAAELNKEGKPDEAIRVWRASLARLRQQKNFTYPETATLKKLLPALLAAGRKDEAAQEVDRYFFPPAQPKSALGFEARSTERNWATVNYGVNGNNDLQGTAIMRLAASAGALEELRAKAVQAATAHPEDPEKFLVLLIDVLRRDPAQLAALQKAFDEAIATSGGPRNLKAIATLRTLARLLGEWPEGRALALHVYEKSPEFGGAFDGWNKLHTAELALALQEDEAARQALRAWISWTDRGTGILPQVDVAQELSAVDLMGRASLETEAATWLKKAQAVGDSLHRPELKSWAEDLTQRAALLAGEAGHTQITVWAVPATKGSPKTTICWEIGAPVGGPPNRPSNSPKSAKPQDPPLSTTGQDLPALDGKFTVELFHGVSEAALQPLATIPAAKMRGTWESPEALGEGYIVGLLRAKEIEAYSPKAFVPAGPNLLVNPDPGSSAAPGTPAAEVPGWPGLCTADTITLAGGPNPGGHYARLGMLGDFVRSTVSLARVPLEPGQSYYFAGWLRGPVNGGGARLSGRFLDKDGKPVGQNVDSAGTSAPGRWTFCGMRLVRTPMPRGGGGSARIPENAAFFEPSVVTGSTISDLTGLYFGEIAPAAGGLK